MQPLISIITAYKFNEHLFDGMVLPGPIVKDNVQIAPAIDKEDVIDLIIAECGELNLVWSNPDYLQNLIAKWSKANLYNWERMYLALYEEYDPLTNYDRHEQIKDTRTPDLTTQDNGGSTLDGTTANYENGYNSGEQVKANSTTVDNDVTTNNTSKLTGSDISEHEGRLWGNIGVTTSAQMLSGELEVRMKDNIHDIIVSMFRDKFCILVY